MSIEIERTSLQMRLGILDISEADAGPRLPQAAETLACLLQTYYDALPKRYRRTFGSGDIHLPPYFGKIPFDTVFSMLRDQPGYWICEYDSQSFLPFNREICTRVRDRLRCHL